eukprot:gb/GFBE01056064.1/.p1 GENE.gb/GFBE01056064.1/~~gb/GFBE01056064.1/.p1  ORF type:complete len:228 (+),score=32.03 gb/GFBE01056064.1/:1-684(+)
MQAMPATGTAVKTAGATASLLAMLSMIAVSAAEPWPSAFAHPANLQQLVARPRQLTGRQEKPLAVVTEPTEADLAASPAGSRVQRFLSTASRFGAMAACVALAALPRRRGRNGQSRRRLQGLGASLTAGLPAGFKAFSQSNAALMLRLSTLNFCKIYMAMLVLRITIMWFPNINPYRQPFYSMIQLTDPYLNLFRGWMPPIFGIDLSVILAFVVIQAVIDGLAPSPF